MKNIISISFLLVITGNCFSQIITTDSTKTLDSVILKAFETKTVASACLCGLSAPIFGQKTSLLNGLNIISGVRMEERSPGSYRLSIRGSSLRSPFGVRNIKVYWNGIPITDPGGNTYFNQFAWNNFSNIDIVKGPVASMYGAGTGGLILLDRYGETWYNGITSEYITGSYNLQNIFITVRAGKYTSYGNLTRNTFTYAHNQTDGYRVHTNMRRDNFSWTGRIAFEKQKLTASVLFTDLYYQTPGALTLSEFNADPKAARPAGGGFPSAVNAKAAIWQKNLLVGINDEIDIARRFKNTSAVYGTFTQIKNAAIRNYERRSEPSFGARTVFKYDPYITGILLRTMAGAEFQQGYFNTQVSKNRNGNPDTLQTDDDVNNTALILFTQADVTIKQWSFVAGLSSNSTRLAITRLNSYPVITQRSSFRNELAPRFAIMKRFDGKHTNLNWQAVISKGFSPPTTAEVLPSTGVISTDLEAEKGWNYETSLRAYLLKNKLTIEITGFYFKLYDALVQRRDLSGADFFVNAGNIRQQGIELHSDYKQTIGNGSSIRQIEFRGDLTLNRFRYGNFIKGTDDFSGKKVPSVPSSVLSLMADINMVNGIYFSVNYYGASSIYLNDANTFKADPYHLLGCQLGWKKKVSGIWMNIYAGIDNLLNETYSLGNDINAAANRFYNTAPPRNYYAGIVLDWIKKTTPKK